MCRLQDDAKKYNLVVGRQMAPTKRTAVIFAGLRSEPFMKHSSRTGRRIVPHLMKLLIPHECAKLFHCPGLDALAARYTQSDAAKSDLTNLFYHFSMGLPRAVQFVRAELSRNVHCDARSLIHECAELLKRKYFQDADLDVLCVALYGGVLDIEVKKDCTDGHLKPADADWLNNRLRTAMAEGCCVLSSDDTLANVVRVLVPPFMLFGGNKQRWSKC